MPFADRIEALKQLKHQEKKLNEKEHLPKMEEMIEIEIDDEILNQYKNEKFVPQKRMKYKEYLSIKSNFTEADFDTFSYIMLN